MAAFTIRGYTESMRGTAAAWLGPFGLAAEDLPPMEVRVFRWWEDELAAIKAGEPDEDEEEAPGKGRAPKKRSISDLFAAAPPVEAVNVSNSAEDEEALAVIIKRSKEMKRKRRLEEEAAAAAAEAEPSAGEGREAEGNFGRKKALDKTNLRQEMDIPDPEASKETVDEHDLISEKELIPDLKGRKHGKLNSSQKKANRLKYTEGRKAIKVGKQRDIKKILPLQGILKKYTKHTSVKMVKEKHGSSKGTGVIELCRKSVKRVKFSEANNALSRKKKRSKRPQLESLCDLISDAMTSSSSSTDMSSEVNTHIVAESSSSHMPEKTTGANKNTNHDNHSELNNTGLTAGLLDLNQALPEPANFNKPSVSNSEVSNIEYTQVGTLCTDQQDLDNGGKNQRDLSFDPHRQEPQQHATELDTRTKGKSPYALSNCTAQDSVQLQQNWCSMVLHHGVSQLSSGGEPSSSQRQQCNLSHNEIHSNMNVQQESRPAAGHTLRLMGKDLTVSQTRVDYLAETAPRHTGPSINDHLTTNLVLELPRQGQPFLSLQAQRIPIVSADSASTAHVSGSSARKPHVSASSAGTADVHFGYRTPHNVSYSLPTASVFFGDPSRYEDRFRDSTNLQSHRNVSLGCPPLINHGNAAFLHSSPAPWRYYSDHSTRTDSPSGPFSPGITQHVTPPSHYHANMPEPYGVYPVSSSVHPHNSGSFTWSHPDQIVQGISDSRASAALASRNAETGTARAIPDSSNASSSSRFVLRSGPVKLSAGAKHILMPSENTEDDNSAPMYSCVSFGTSNGKVSAPQNKRSDFRKF